MACATKSMSGFGTARRYCIDVCAGQVSVSIYQDLRNFVIPMSRDETSVMIPQVASSLN